MSALLLVLALAVQVAPTAAPTAQTPGQAEAPVVVVPRDPALEARTSAVASELRCPVCQGLSIQASPSELAQNMRAVVREQLAEGKTPAQVKAYFVARYGEWVLLEPEPRGFNLAVYLLPVLAVLGGASLVALVIRRWTRSGAGAGPAGVTVLLEEPELAPWDEPTPPR